MIKLPSPHRGQRIVQQQAKRYNWLSAGRRWRKTTLVMSISVRAALDRWSCFWGAPTYDQVRIGWDEAIEALQGEAEFKQSTMTVTFPTGGRIIYRSLDDPDNARGHSFKLAVFDEAGDIKEAAYYNVVRPILADNPDSIFWGIGSPRGRNYFWRENMKAFNREDSMSWIIPTMGCYVENGQLFRKPHPLENTDFSWDEIVGMFDTMTEMEFRQEVLAEFGEGEGVVFRNIKACMNAPKANPKDHEGHTIVAGVDWGKQNDFTAISVGCKDCGVELDRDRFNKIDYHFQRKRLKRLWKKWKIGNFLVEMNSIGEPNFEELQREGFPVRGFWTTGTSKPKLIENLALALEKEEWQFQHDIIWTSELEAYERKISPRTERSYYSAPSGMFDDTVIARALMVRHQYESRFVDNPFYD